MSIAKYFLPLIAVYTLLLNQIVGLQCQVPIIQSAIEARTVHIEFVTAATLLKSANSATKEDCLSNEGKYIALLEDYLEQTIDACPNWPDSESSLNESLRITCRDKYQVDYFAQPEIKKTSEPNAVKNQATRATISITFIMGIIYVCVANLL